MSLYLSRCGESSHFFQRSDKRVYSIDDEWYFTIRRGFDQGPYASEDASRQALLNFVHEQLEFESHLDGMKTSA